jgi:hypothetical protein
MNPSCILVLFFSTDFLARQTCLRCNEKNCPVNEKLTEDETVVGDIVVRKPGDIIIGGKM